MERLNNIIGRSTPRRPLSAAQPAQSNSTYQNLRSTTETGQEGRHSLPEQQAHQQTRPFAHPQQLSPSSPNMGSRSVYGKNTFPRNREQEMSSDELDSYPASHSPTRYNSSQQRNTPPRQARDAGAGRSQYNQPPQRHFQQESYAPVQQSPSHPVRSTRPPYAPQGVQVGSSSPEHYYHADDYTSTSSADVAGDWNEEDEDETGMLYGDWEQDGQEILVYRRADVEGSAPVREHIPAYTSPPRNVTRDLRSTYDGNYGTARGPVPFPAPTMPEIPPAALPQPEPHVQERQQYSRRVTQPLNPQLIQEMARERNVSAPNVQRPSYGQAQSPARNYAHRHIDPVSSVTSVRPVPAQFPHVPASPLPGKQACARCRGAGYLRADVPFGHPNFGKPIACECKEAERRDKRRQQLREMSNLDAFRNQTFSSFNPNISGVQEAYAVAQEFAENPEGWLVLIGPNGCGKTHLAVAIANRVLDSGAVVLFEPVPDLLDHLRAAFAPTATEVYDQLFSKMREAELLILDDLGAQQSSPWANEKLFQLLNYRYNMSMPTVITANAKGLQSIDERIRSRLGDANLVESIIMDRAQDYRPRRTQR